MRIEDGEQEPGCEARMMPPAPTPNGRSQIRRIAAFERDEAQAQTKATDEDVLSLIKRRPCTAQDVASGLGIHIHVALKALGHLVDAGQIAPSDREGNVYYVFSG